MIGIYKTTNNINNECYIMSSACIERRWKEHLCRYNKNGRHYKYHIYRAFRKYGIDNFKFEFLEICKKEELIDRETYCYEKLNPVYNMINPKDNPMFDDTVRKIASARCKEAWLDRSESSKDTSLSNLSFKNAYPKRGVCAIEISTGERFYFESLYMASNTLSIPRSSVSQILKPKHIRKSSKGYKFEYSD